ncbi:MAG TPA: transglycosylase family protein [Solirubrobacterales bacterium]|nr:transglycosylase family protein [Solirubrobacterales bacterium]
MQNRTKTLTRSTIGGLIAAGSIALGTVASAAAAELVDLEVPLERSHLERSLDAAELRNDYERAYKKAKRLDVAPERNAAEQQLSPARLERKLETLSTDVGKAKRQAKRQAKREAKFESPGAVGVSTGTLESIAACESGGDPTAVSSSGSYRGKYQFDYGTWAAVGGSGDPAAAPEAEQDYRAALLYSQSGSSPWPVCGS